MIQDSFVTMVYISDSIEVVQIDVGDDQSCVNAGKLLEVLSV